MGNTVHIQFVLNKLNFVTFSASSIFAPTCILRVRLVIKTHGATCVLVFTYLGIGEVDELQ